MDNQQAYSTVDFDYWAHKRDLDDMESYLIEKFLDKRKKTLEAGTGGGRILLEMQKLGFTSLYGYDFIPKFIEQAKQRDSSQDITFKVQDATCLSYEDYSFDQILYLQQIICTLETNSARTKALQEAYRILKHGGIALFSFLNFDSRSRSAAYFLYIWYLRLLRNLKGSKCSIQHLPRLKLNGKPNFSALLDRTPYTYWYKPEEVYEALTEVGFDILAITSDVRHEQRKLYRSMETFREVPRQGFFYFVCTKRT